MPRPTALTAADVQPIATYMTDRFWRDVGEQAPQPLDNQAGWGFRGVITVDMMGLDADGAFMARAALEAWAQVTRLEFREVADPRQDAQIRFTDNGSGATTGFDWDRGQQIPGFGDLTPLDDVSTATVNIGQGWLDKYGTGIGSYSFQAYLHEIGHALGLGHTGNYNTTVPAWRDRPGFDRDSFQTSVMSYYGQNLNPNDDGATRAAVITPQMADILAIRKLYDQVDFRPTPYQEATEAAEAANTVWGHGSNLDGYLGDYFRTYYKEGKVQPYAVTFTIFDFSGTDVLDLSHAGQKQQIDLAPGGVSSAFNHIGNIIIDPTSWIENANAGRGNDQVWGNILSNTLNGNGGQDQIWGDAGDDRINGGEGKDTLWGEAGQDRIDGGTGADRMDGGAGNDSLTGGEGADRLAGDDGHDRIEGGLSADRIEGGAGNDRLMGGEAGDRIAGGAGDDIINGGAGSDKLSGDAGADMFVFDGAAFGADVITGFDLSEDRLQIARAFDADQDLAGQITVSRGDMMIRLPGFGNITLKGVTDIDAVLDRIDFL
jgi:serralysin